MTEFALADDVYLHIHELEKFRSVILQVSFLWPNEKDHGPASFLLSFLLSDSCQKYPGKQEVQQKIDELYGASLRIDYRPVGAANRMRFSLSGCENGCVGEDIYPEFYELLSEFIFRPRTENGLFPESMFAECKKQAVMSVRMVMDDPGCECEQLGFEAYGGYLAKRNLPTAEEIEALDNRSVASFWEKIRENARVDINVLGNVDVQRSELLAKRWFPFEGRSCPCHLAVYSPGEYSFVQSERDVPQTSVLLIYDTGHLGFDGRVPAFMIGNGIFGGLPTSLLFQNIREEQGLCYSIDSAYHPYDGTLRVHCAVKPEDLEALISSVSVQAEAMKNGCFSEEDTELSKMMYISSWISSFDSPGVMVTEDYRKAVTKSYPGRPEMLEAFRRVSRQDIIDAFADLKLRTIAAVGPGGEHA